MQYNIKSREALNSSLDFLLSKVINHSLLIIAYRNKIISHKLHQVIHILRENTKNLFVTVKFKKINTAIIIFVFVNKFSCELFPIITVTNKTDFMKYIDFIIVT